MTKNISLYHKRLLQEKTLVLNEMSEAGVADIDSLRSDSSDVADRLKTYEENNAITRRLSNRLREINTALEKIKNDAKNFGICRVCGKEIEEDRLEANPAATTCKEHVTVKV